MKIKANHEQNICIMNFSKQDNFQAEKSGDEDSIIGNISDKLYLYIMRYKVLEQQ